LRETVAGEIQGGVLGRATPCGYGCHTWSCYIYARSCYYMLHDTWVQWTVSPCYQDPLTHHLFDMQLSCGMGHRIVVLVRVIKYARYMHLHHILHCLQWSLTWHVFSRYWHSRLMWYVLSWLHDILRHTMLFYLVISSSYDLVIMLHTVTCPWHFMFIIYMLHYACTVSLYMIYLPDYSCYCYYFQFSILPNILSLYPTYCYYIFIFSLLSFSSLRVLLLVRFWWTFIIFFSI